MAKKPNGSTKLAGLRLQAEKRLRVTKRDVAAMPVKDVQQLVHELQVHQVELEMQNEELRRTQEELEAARDRYVELYDAAPTGYLTLDPKGMILEANLPACTLLGMNRKLLIGKPVIGYVAAKDQATLCRHIREIFEIGVRQACEVDLAQPDDAPVSVQFQSVVVQHEADAPTHVHTTLQDITERTRAAAARQLWEQGLARQRQLEEREQIGHDLHDGILQSLYAIGLGLEGGKLEASEKNDALLVRSIGELNSVMQEVRAFIRRLGTEGQLKASLPVLLRTMADTLARLHGRQVRVSIDEVAPISLSPAQSQEILKLAKEALSNSLRHAQATFIQVSLLQRKGAVCLAVRDNGVGFDPTAVSGAGHGFASMTARAASLGAILSTFSKPQQGTCLVLNLSKKSKNDGTGQGGCPCGSMRNEPVDHGTMQQSTFMRSPY